MEGFIYILSNECMPGLVKVGQTRNTPSKRAAEISANESAPKPMRVEYYAFVGCDPYPIEQKVHGDLRAHSEGKEWFRCDVPQAITAVRRACAGILKHEEIFYIDPEEVRRLEEEAERLREEEARQEKERVESARQEEYRRQNELARELVRLASQAEAKKKKEQEQRDQRSRELELKRKLEQRDENQRLKSNYLRQIKETERYMKKCPICCGLRECSAAIFAGWSAWLLSALGMYYFLGLREFQDFFWWIYALFLSLAWLALDGTKQWKIKTD